MTQKQVPHERNSEEGVWKLKTKSRASAQPGKKQVAQETLRKPRGNTTKTAHAPGHAARGRTSRRPAGQGTVRREGAETTTSASRHRGHEPRGDQGTRAPSTGPDARLVRPPARRQAGKEGGGSPAQSSALASGTGGPLLGHEARDDTMQAKRRAGQLQDTGPCPERKRGQNAGPKGNRQEVRSELQDQNRGG